MLQHSRTDRPAQPKPWDRRLTLQRLEERLALSTVSPTMPSAPNLDLSIEGGFVNVSVLRQDFTLLNSDISPTTSFDNLSLSGFLENPLLFNIADVLSNDFDFSIIPPPDPFPVDPGGGVVDPHTRTQPFGPLPIEEILPPADPNEFVAEKPLIAEEMSPRLTHNLALSRGREVFFKIATLAPPQTLVRPDRVVPGTSDAYQAPTQNKSAPVAREVQAYSPSTTEESPIEATAVEQPATEKVGSVLRSQETHFQETKRAVHSTTNHGRLATNRALPASLPKAVNSLTNMPLTASQLDTVAQLEEEARSQVFADWRNRDLIALPLLVALAAGPRLVRNLRSPTTEAQQLPPKQNRQTVVL